MSMRDECLAANARYATTFVDQHLPAAPARKLAAVVCMDARLLPDRILGLHTGDAHIIRNAGGIVTDDALRSLIVSHTLLGTNEFFVINHTDCGMMTYSDEHLRHKLRETGGPDPSDVQFYTFTDLEQNVREQVAAIKSNPYLPGELPVHGFIYDVRDGRLREVV